MPTKLLALLAALPLLAAACGSTSLDQATGSGEEVSSDELASDDSAIEASTTSSVEVADSTTSEVMTDIEDVDPGSADDRSLVDAESGPVGALLFADTIDGPEAPSSARFEGRMLIVGSEGSELPGAYEIVVSGAYDVAANASDLTIDMGGLIAAAAEAEGEQLPPEMLDLIAQPMQVIVVEEMGWMKWPFLSLFGGSADSGDVWIELGADDVADTTESFGFDSTAGDPTELLERLAAAEASVEDLGVETVNGVEARHWRALLDLETLAAQSSPEEQAELTAEFGDLTGAEFPLDVWIGVADGYIYRYVLDLSSDVVLADDPAAEVESVTLSFDFYGYNTDQGISPPPSDLVVSGEELLSGFGGNIGD